MFQDWEYISSNLIGESWLAENIFEIIEAIDELDDDKKAAFEVWLNHGNHDITTKDITDLIRSFEDDFRGAYNDEEDYAYEIVDECYDLPEFAKTYFDYAKFARDLFMGDYWFEDGYVFRCS
jgi:antirestriction protein